MKKKVLIYAYSRLNLGDDLFVKILCERYPNSQFYIMSNFNYRKGLSQNSNLKIIYRIPFIDGIIRKLKINFSLNQLVQKIIIYHCDLIVNIGGSIFMESKDWKHKSKILCDRVNSNKPYFIIGSNFGPYSDNDYMLEYRKIFSRVTDICFRDVYSFSLFNELHNVRYAADVVFSMPDKYYQEEGSERQDAVISIIDLSNREKLKIYETEYLDKLVELSRIMLKNNINVKFMSFCRKEGDDKAIEKILKKFSDKEINQISFYKYHGNIEEALLIIRNAKYIVATRFHAMILGWLYRKNVLPIIYSEKTSNVISDIGFNGVTVDIKSLEKFSSEKINEYLVNSDIIEISEQTRLANLQFKYLDELLGE